MAATVEPMNGGGPASATRSRKRVSTVGISQLRCSVDGDDDDYSNGIGDEEMDEGIAKHQKYSKQDAFERTLETMAFTPKQRHIVIEGAFNDESKQIVLNQDHLTELVLGYITNFNFSKAEKAYSCFPTGSIMLDQLFDQSDGLRVAMSTTGVQCGGFGTGGFGSGGFGSSPPRISGAVTSGFGSPNNAQQQTNGYHQTIGFGTPPGCGFSSITVPGGFGKSLLAPELEDDNQALADVLKKLRELLPLVNNQNFSGYLKEFYTRCVVVQMKKVHDDGKTLELASMLKLLGYEGFSVLALAEVKELAEAMGWKFTGNRVDSVGGFFQGQHLINNTFGVMEI